MPRFGAGNHEACQEEGWAEGRSKRGAAAVRGGVDAAGLVRGKIG